MSVPRKIWVTDSKKGEWLSASVEKFGDTPHLYHHDDVVRELVEALRYMINHAEQTERKEGIYWDATNIARAALAKIAQDDVK